MHPAELARREQAAHQALATRGTDASTVILELGFNSIAEICQAYREKQLSLGANYDRGIMRLMGNKFERRMNLAFAVIPWLLALLGSYLAFTQGHWSYVLIAAPILGINSLIKSRPEIGNAVGGIGISVLVVMLVRGNWHWSIIIGGVVLSTLCSRLRTGYYSEVITERALQSAALFSLLFVGHKINVRNNSTGRIIRYQNH